MLRAVIILGTVALIGVQAENRSFENSCFLQAVGGAPVDEEGPLVLRLRAFCAILQTQVRHLTGSLALLELPPRHVAIDEQVPLLRNKAGARANNKNSARCLLQAVSLFRECALIQKF